MQKKTAAFHVRITPAQRARLDAIHKRKKTTDSTIGPDLIEAFCEYVERTDNVDFPIQITAAPAPKAKSA